MTEIPLCELRNSTSEVLRRRLGQAARSATRRMPQTDGNDSWIAATAIAHGLPLVTRHRGFLDVPGLDALAL